MNKPDKKHVMKSGFARLSHSTSNLQGSEREGKTLLYYQIGYKHRHHCESDNHMRRFKRENAALVSRGFEKSLHRNSCRSEQSISELLPCVYEGHKISFPFDIFLTCQALKLHPVLLLASGVLQKKNNLSSLM